MKNQKVIYKLASVVAIVFLFVSCGSKSNTNMMGFADFADDDGDYVYICTGPYSKKYHKTEDCMWLENCSEDIERISIGEAEDMGRTPCKGCYGD